jgi:Lung seven transmembrane receptor
VYFAATLALAAKRFRNAVDEGALQHSALVYVLPVAALEGVLAAAVWAAFRGSLRHLKGKGSRLRLNVYRLYAGCVAAVAASCVAYLTFAAYFHATHPQNQKWQYEWVRLPLLGDA